MNVRRLLSFTCAAAVTLACLLGFFAPGASLAAPARTRHQSITQGMDCSACHTTGSWKTLHAATGGQAFDHSRTGFPLTQRHAGVSCMSCHGGERAITRDCAGCHADVHASQLGSSCDGCHSAASWFQTEAIARHRRTRLPLTGMHAVTECKDCHLRNNDRFASQVPADCHACHAADYQRQDIHPLHVGVPGDPQSPPFPRDCSQCHRASAWTPAFSLSPLVRGGFALSSLVTHDSVFPLSRGAHRALDCQSCHASAATPRAVRCNGCHAHEETKLRQQHQRVAAFSQACLTCHAGGATR
ncbi:MAG TPA: hypothetical protein VJU61_15605 [Polyangiaceae bacterium]|nr:hypothetical protein [Polyangiaceae bacterium]